MSADYQVYVDYIGAGFADYIFDNLADAEECFDEYVGQRRVIRVELSRSWSSDDDESGTIEYQLLRSWDGSDAKNEATD